MTRSNLNSTVEAALDTGQVVLLNAPAGWGKTTAIAAWAETQHDQISIGWYSLDRTDRDPVLFLQYLLTVLSPCYPELLHLLEQLHADTTPESTESIIQQTISIVVASDCSFLLVLDDIHVLLEDPNDATQRLMEVVETLVNLTSIRVILLSQVVIPGMMRLLMQGRVKIIDSEVLKLSVLDVVTLVTIRYGDTIDQEQAQRLVEWADGWPAAIILALENWYRRGVVSGMEINDLLPMTSTNQLYYFLAQQVFDPLPAPLQEFLVTTAVLDELTPERCNELRQAHDSALFLADIQGRGLFIIARGTWIRYIDLFRTFLLTQLHKTPEREQQLLRRSAELSQSWGNYDFALDRWIELNELETASNMVLVVGPLLRRQGQHRTIIGWLARLQTYGPLSGPLLLLQARVAVDLLDWNTAYAAIQLALISKDPAIVAEARLLEAAIACVRRDDARATEIVSTMSIETLPPHLHAKWYEINGRVALNQGQLKLAITSLKQALTANDPTYRHTAHARPPAHLYDLLGMALAMEGDYEAALYYLKQADSVWQTLQAPARRVNTLNNLGTLATEEGRLAEARTLLKEGLYLAERYGRLRFQVLLLCGLGDVALIETQFVQALNYYAAASKIASNAELSPEYGCACANALRSAILGAEETERDRWQQALDSLSPTGVAANGGLIGLTRALGEPDPRVAMEYLAQAEAASYLAPHDRAQLSLLRVQLVYRLDGWAAAKSYWQALQNNLPPRHLDALLQAQCTIAGNVLEAVDESPLSQRLLSSRVDDPDTWSFQALGQFTISCSGQEQAPIVRPIDQLVIIRLLEAGVSGISALDLWEDVWGDHLYSSGALRQSLNRIRNTAGLSIQMRQGHCHLLLPWATVSYDVAQFESPLHTHKHSSDSDAVSALKQQLALYLGDFLCHLHHESRWLLQRRTALCRHALSIREKLAQIVEKDDVHYALQLYNAVLAQDGCREIAAAGAMRCAIRLGDRTLAISLYQQVCSRLHEDLGADPSAVLQQLYRQTV